MERFADVIDMEQVHVEMEMALRIDQIRHGGVVVAVGSPHYIDCGCPVPEERRRCMPSRQRCVARQGILEHAR